MKNDSARHNWRRSLALSLLLAAPVVAVSGCGGGSASQSGAVIHVQVDVCGSSKASCTAAPLAGASIVSVSKSGAVLDTQVTDEAGIVNLSSKALNGRATIVKVIWDGTERAESIAGNSAPFDLTIDLGAAIIQK